jgi:protein transport protein SEC31
LELYDLHLSESSSSSPRLLGSVKTQSRFSSLAWTPGTLGGSYPFGMLAGGMENGTVHVWNPQAVMEGTDSLIASFSQHASGPVKALQFSKLNPTQLATGGSDGKVLIFHLDQLPEGGVTTPCETNQQKTQITAVAWNTQVGHIVASAAADGTVAVWDLKARKAWCELRAETSGMAVSDLAWNPTEGLHLLTASADDRNPVIKLWDLRASTSMPLTSLSGHQKGLLSMAWCPHDDHLLLS